MYFSFFILYFECFCVVYFQMISQELRKLFIPVFLNCWLAKSALQNMFVCISYTLSQTNFIYLVQKGAVVVVIIWQLDLQQPMQTLPIITKVVSSNPAHGKVYQIQHYVIKFVSDFLWVSSTNKTDCHDIAKILLSVALNTITLILTLQYISYCY